MAEGVDCCEEQGRVTGPSQRGEGCREVMVTDGAGEAGSKACGEKWAAAAGRRPPGRTAQGPRQSAELRPLWATSGPQFQSSQMWSGGPVICGCHAASSPPCMMSGG